MNGIFKVSESRFLIDHQRFYARYFGKIFHLLHRHIFTITGMVCSSCQNPRRTGRFKIR